MTGTLGKSLMGMLVVSSRILWTPRGFSPGYPVDAPIVCSKPDQQGFHEISEYNISTGAWTTLTSGKYTRGHRLRCALLT